VTAKSISSKATGKGPRWILVLFFGVFFLAGSGFFYGFFLRAYFRIQEARSWVETPCTIVSSKVESHTGGDSTTYSINMVYSYTVDGVEYKSSRYSFMTGSSSGYSGKRAVVEANPPGHKTVCYVDPENPIEAVLERGFVADMWFGLIPAVFILVGAGGMFFTVRSMLRKGEEERLGISRKARDFGRRERTAPSPTGRVTLEPTSSPTGKLIGITVAAVFWNGIVSVFVWQIVKGWRAGHGEWFGTIFLIPFMLIGLVLIGGIFYQILALFNPRPRITVSSNAVSLGGMVELDWQFSGRVDRISDLKITLEGREEATYRRGTNTHTDKEVFREILIAEERDRFNMASGRTTFTIPADTMHSFKAENNEIVWTLKIHGDIASWPDVNDEFEFKVLPAGEGEPA
jgi:hypothetical protein